MRKLPAFIILLIAISLGACTYQAEGDKGAIDITERVKGDNTLYGLACDGTNDSTLVFLPNSGGDPVSYDIIDATRNHQIFGSLAIGDWVGMMVDPHDKRKANLVVDLDELKGTWTFQVIPKASPVGLIVKENSLDDNSPVAYPKVTVYTSWHIINGRLYLYKDTVDEQGKRIPQSKVGFDDGTFVYLGTDSMAALFGKKVMQYHRKANAIEANAKAQAAEKKVSSADTIKK